DRQAKSVPRARGAASIELKSVGHRTRLSDLRMSGCMKALFPRTSDRTDAIIVNTSGGLTGGDKLSLDIVQGPDTSFCLTTQAAERVYRAHEGCASVKSRVVVEAKSTLFWLPQELILFEGAALKRQFHCDLNSEARLVMVEPIVFGRQLMGETLTNITFRDHVSIDQGGRAIYRDVIDLSDRVGDQLNALAGGAGAGAMATLVYAAPDAENWLQICRDALGPTGGASLLRRDFLVARLVAPDSLALRRALMALLDQITGDSLPRSWRL
ncbi:MAG: urease accessory protein UreD, partial [Pseudomonadota bacterium]